MTRAPAARTRSPRGPARRAARKRRGWRWSTARARLPDDHRLRPWAARRPGRPEGRTRRRRTPRPGRRPARHHGDRRVAGQRGQAGGISASVSVPVPHTSSGFAGFEAGVEQRGRAAPWCRRRAARTGRRPARRRRRPARARRPSRGRSRSRRAPAGAPAGRSRTARACPSARRGRGPGARRTRGRVPPTLASPPASAPECAVHERPPGRRGADGQRDDGDVGVGRPGERAPQPGRVPHGLQRTARPPGSRVGRERVVEVVGGSW